MKIVLLSLLSFLFHLQRCDSINNFWYGNTRGPLIYDTVNYANLTVRIMRPIDEGPGQNLMFDPIHPDQSVPIYTGNTINRESFDTQFVLDMEYALHINRDRIYVTTKYISKMI